MFFPHFPCTRRIPRDKTKQEKCFAYVPTQKRRFNANEGSKITTTSNATIHHAVSRLFTVMGAREIQVQALDNGGGKPKKKCLPLLRLRLTEQGPPREYDVDAPGTHRIYVAAQSICQISTLGN